MTAPEDTRPDHHNGGGAPTEAELIDYLHDADRSVSLDQLTKAVGASRDSLKARLKELDDRGLIIVSIGLYHVMIRLADAAHPVTDGGSPVDGTDAGNIEVEASAELTLKEIYTVLSNHRRRRVIRTVARQARRHGVDETYAPVSPLSAVVAASEDDVAATSNTPADAPTDEQHATYVSLVQTHLPLLDDLGVVEYYSRPQKVGATETLLALDAVMNVVDDIAMVPEE